MLDSPTGHLFRQPSLPNHPSTSAYETYKGLNIKANKQDSSPGSSSLDGSNEISSKIPGTLSTSNGDSQHFNGNQSENAQLMKQTVQSGPLITSIDASGEHEVQSSRDSAEDEEALMSQVTYRITPKAHIPDLYTPKSSKSESPSDSITRSVAKEETPEAKKTKSQPGGHITLLNPMEPMELKKRCSPRAISTRNSPLLHNSLAPIPGFPSDDPGLTNPTLYRGENEQLIPSISEDRRLAEAVASYSGSPPPQSEATSSYVHPVFNDNRKRTSLDSMSNGGTSIEFKNLLADSYSHSTGTTGFRNSVVRRNSSIHSKSSGSSDAFPDQYPSSAANYQHQPSESRFSFNYSIDSQPIQDFAEPTRAIPQKSYPAPSIRHAATAPVSVQPIQSAPLPPSSVPPPPESLSTYYGHQFPPSYANVLQPYNSMGSYSSTYPAPITYQPITTPVSQAPNVHASPLPGHDLVSRPLYSYPYAEHKAGSVPQVAYGYNKAPEIEVIDKRNATVSKSDAKVHKCMYPGCGWSFVRSSDHKRHIRSHEKPSLRCPFWEVESSCSKKAGLFYRLDVLKRHLRLVHLIRPSDGSKEGGRCRICLKVFKSTRSFVDHCEDCAKSLKN